MELVSLASPLLVVSLLAAAQAAQDPNQGYIRSVPSPTRSVPTQGLTHMSLDDRAVDVYIKKPQGEGTWPGVVLLHDSMGLGKEMIRMADRLVGEGFVVIALDLYGGRIPLDADKGREMTVLMNEQEAVGAIEAVAGYLKYRADVGDHRVGLVGFDLGGRLALLGAMGSSDVSAVVVAYGRPPSDPGALRRIGCPILGLFGGKDETIPPSDAVAFRSALSTARRSAEVRIFDGAGHGFMKEGDPSFQAETARDAWGRMITFLRQNL